MPPRCPCPRSFTWYYDHRCCLCKVAACEDSGDGEDAGTPSSPGGSGSEGDGSCGLIEYDTDYFGGDIVPVTSEPPLPLQACGPLGVWPTGLAGRVPPRAPLSPARPAALPLPQLPISAASLLQAICSVRHTAAKWADTAVAAASPEDCCEACTLYDYCQVGPQGECHGVATHWEGGAVPTRRSAAAQRTPRGCLPCFDALLSAGPGATTHLCRDPPPSLRCRHCQAWTFTRASHCKERLPGAPGCCFLKKGTGYEKRSASGMISGVRRQGRAAAACAGSLRVSALHAGGG